MPERLRRLEYTFQRHPIYFVTACSYGRRAILHDAAVHARLVAFGNTGGNRGAWVGGYVVMPDHLHLFVTIDDQCMTLSTWVKSKNALSKALRIQGVLAPHWQKGFFDHILRGEESYATKWEYVRENAVRAGLVKEWNEWPFLGEIFDLEFREDG